MPAIVTDLTTKPLPNTLGACADEYYAMMQKRLAKEKEAEAFGKREAQLRDYIINTLPASDATGIMGKKVSVRVEKKTVYQAKDWEAIRAYITKNAKKNPGVYAIMQRRLSAETVAEMFANGEKVPGVEPFEVKKLAYSTKRK